MPAQHCTLHFPAVVVLLALATASFAQADAGGKRALVEINTTAGRMVVELYNKTPVHRDNFLKLVKEHFYDSTLVYRVVPSLMVLGGDPDSRTADDRNKLLGQGGPGYTLAPEIEPSLLNRKGALGAVLADADTSAGPRDSGSEFYLVQGRTWKPADLHHLEERLNKDRPDSAGIHYSPDQETTYEVLGGAPRLDGSYTVFGQVVEGLDVLDRIADQPCDGYDRPLTDVRLWMRVINEP